MNGKSGAPPSAADATQFLEDLPDPTGVFAVGEPIVPGSVWSGRLIKDNRDVSLKVIDYTLGDTDDEEYIATEVFVNKLVATSDCVGINPFIGAYRCPVALLPVEGPRRKGATHSVILLHELCHGGSVADFATSLARAHDAAKRGRGEVDALPEVAIASVLRQVLLGLVHVHSHGVIHRDVKGSNILFTSDGLPRLSDFGVAEVASDDRIHKHGSVGTAYWMSPEMCATDLPGGAAYDARCDVWSLGITAIELAEGKPPHAGVPAVKAMTLIPAQPAPQFADPNQWSPAFRDFVAQCLVKDFTKRKNAAALMGHPFIAQLTPQATAQAARVLVACNHFGRSAQHDKKHQADNRRSYMLSPVGQGPQGGQSPDDNLVSASELTAESMRAQLKRRFQQGTIYTYVGDILVALNPFAPVPLYDAPYTAFYNLQSDRSNCFRPHVYAMALKAFRAMSLSGEGQACIISGESGAGKTETAKYFVKHLLELSTTAKRSSHGYRNNVFEFMMNALLEPFGNAKMIANDNSSRFGKLVELQFTQQNQIVGSRMRHYLLEKARVARQPAGEFNFHIFHMLLDGLDDSAATNLHLVRQPGAYACLNGGTPATYINNLPVVVPAKEAHAPFSSEHGAQAFALQAQQMLEAGFSIEDLDGLYSTLAIILHMGNLDFEDTTSGKDHYISLRVTGPLELVSTIMGCAADDLGNALITNIMVMRGETIVLKNSAPSARDVRDAATKALYSRLFSWLVNTANRLLATPQSATHASELRSIGVLDIFGFESLKNNGLEQMCINVTNEKLQHFFNSRIFGWQIQALRDDGITPEAIDFEDNTATMSLFFSTPIGIFALMDEETRFPNASDASLTDKLVHQLRSHPNFVTPHGRENDFVVRHYAGDIRYATNGWLERNRDSLTPSITSLFRNSKLRLVAELFSLSQTATGGLKETMDKSMLLDRQSNARALIRTLRTSVWSNPKKMVSEGQHQQPMASQSKSTSPTSPDDGGSRLTRRITLSKTQRNANMATLVGHFKASLTDLMRTIEDSHPHFIRCLRPNATGAARMFDDKVVATQMKYTGLLETVRIRRLGYAREVVIAAFVSKYRMLQYGVLEEVDASAASCQSILTNPELSLPASGWKIGKTRVFLKYDTAEELDAHLATATHKADLAIRYLRVALARRRRKKLVAAEQERRRRAAIAAAEEARLEKERQERLAAEEAARREREAAEEAARLHREEEERRRQDEARKERERQEHEAAAAKAKAEADAIAAKKAAAERKAAREEADEAQRQKEAAAASFAAAEQQLRAASQKKKEAPAPVLSREPTRATSVKNFWLARERGEHVSPPPETTTNTTTTNGPARPALDAKRTLTILTSAVQQQSENSKTDTSPTATAATVNGHADAHADGAKRESTLVLRLPNEHRPAADATGLRFVSNMPSEDAFGDYELNMAPPTDIPQGTIDLNRYRNVLPNAVSRVPLPPIAGAPSDPTATFVNANFVEGVDGTVKYIAAQGPMSTTVVAFWRMVWVQRTTLIVMLTQLVEKNRIKCFQYWPEKEGACLDTGEGGIRITHVTSKSASNNLVTQLCLECNGESRTVSHLLFKGWPDQGVPTQIHDVSETLGLLRAHADASPAPVLVHCSAGVGRTGALITADIGIDHVQATGTDADIAKIVDGIRACRGGMITAYEQLELAATLISTLGDVQLTSELAEYFPPAPTAGGSAGSKRLPLKQKMAEAAQVPAPESTHVVPDRRRSESISDDDLARMPRADVASLSEFDATMDDQETSPKAKTSINETVHAEVLDASIERAYNVERALGPSYVHKSQVLTDDADDTVVPRWRQQQTEEKDHEEDYAVAQHPSEKFKSRHFSKKEQRLSQRNTAENAIRTLERDGMDIEPTLAKVFSTTSATPTNTPQNGTPQKAAAPTNEPQTDTPQKAAAPTNKPQTGTPQKATVRASGSPPSSPLQRSSSSKIVRGRKGSTSRSSRSGSSGGSAPSSPPTSPKIVVHPTPASPTPVSTPVSRRRQSSTRKSRRKSQKNKKEAAAPATPGTPRSRRQSWFSKTKEADAPGTPSPATRRRGSMLNRAFGRRRHSSESMSISATESDDEGSVGSIVIDEETAKFLEALSGNREQREREAAERQVQLRKEYAEREAEKERLRLEELQRIEDQAKKEREEQAAREQEGLDDARNRLEELTFDFTFG
eukprot:m.126011 g.126011  ORF g.126011 m.126011 type:complete len:2186 (+) comp11181_c0_seq1:341-6898(+)